MSFFDSKTSVFRITDTGAVVRDISAYLIGIDGLPGPREMADVTVLGDSGRMRKPTLENVSIKLDLLFDDTATTGIDAILGPLRTHTAAVAFDYGPKGKTATYVKYSGNCWVKNYQLTTRVGNMVSGICELDVHGTVTRGTYSA
jgi:hypothetical protein